MCNAVQNNARAGTIQMQSPARINCLPHRSRGIEVDIVGVADAFIVAPGRSAMGAIRRAEAYSCG